MVMYLSYSFVVVVEATSEEDILDGLSLEGLQYFACTNMEVRREVDRQPVKVTTDLITEEVNTVDPMVKRTGSIVDSFLALRQPPTKDDIIGKGQRNKIM